MSAFAQDLERRLIPRWRFTSELANSAEFAGDAHSKRPLEPNRAFLEEKLHSWKRAPSIGTAIDLVSCGVGGGWLEEVTPAAKSLQRNEDRLTPQAQLLVGVVLNSAPAQKSLHALIKAEEQSPALAARGKVSIVRKKLARDGRNPFAWIDLARAYAILGHKKKALLAMEKALHLSGLHRHVLRSAVRLFVHVEDPDRAHSLLLRNPRTPRDPWLVAAELAVSKIAQTSPRFFRNGREILASKNVATQHLTELHSAIGTLQFYDGAHRRARQSIRASLQLPTDNVVAQARWISSKDQGLLIGDDVFDVPLSFEARCWHGIEEHRWDYAQSECDGWIRDEPFSSRPAELGSFMGVALTGDFAFGEFCARTGLRAESGNALLRNNLVVALAYQYRLEEAQAEFGKIPEPLPASKRRHVYGATRGLLNFRRGNIDEGRQDYDNAEEIAPVDEKHQVVLFRAREEIVAKTADAARWVERALAIKPRPQDHFTPGIQSSLRRPRKNESRGNASDT